MIIWEDYPDKQLTELLLYSFVIVLKEAWTSPSRSWTPTAKSFKEMYVGSLFAYLSLKFNGIFWIFFVWLF